MRLSKIKNIFSVLEMAATLVLRRAVAPSRLARPRLLCLPVCNTAKRSFLSGMRLSRPISALSCPRANFALRFDFARRSMSTSGNGIVQFHLADIGEGITECELIQWFVKEGDTIEQFQKLCEVQSDKATVEITSRFDGVIRKLHYKPGDVAKVGSPLMDIAAEGAADAGDEKPVEKAEAKREKKSVEKVEAKTFETAEGVTFATPAVRRVAKENNVDLKLVKGTGKGGRITKEDVLNYVHNGSTSSSTASTSSPISTASQGKEKYDF